MYGSNRGKSKRQVDNKIFDNMMRNQIELEHKLKTIQHKDEVTQEKFSQVQMNRHKQILKKQEALRQKQQLKDELLRKQEEL